MKVLNMRDFSLFVRLFLLSFTFLNIACSKDSINKDVEMDVDENFPTDQGFDIPDSTKTPTINENIESTGSDIVFEDNLILNGERLFINLVLSENEYDKFILGEGNLPMVSKKVYEFLQDDFDYLIILSVEDMQPNDVFFGKSTAVQNLIQGLGSGIFDVSATYGSAGKLKNIIFMPCTEYIQNGPFLHQIAHTWANKDFLPSTEPEHWGYASAAGQLGGFDELIDNGDGTYQGMLNGETGFGVAENGGNSIAYSNLELYLMGLIPDTELEPVEIAINPVALNSNGLFSADAIEERSPGGMISAKGARKPSFENSQKTFTALAIIISKSAIDETKSEAINFDLENFARKASPDWVNSQNFFTATQGRATFDFAIGKESIK